MRALVVPGLLALSACATFDAASFRRTELPRAAFELGCPSQELVVQDIGEREISVAGCGKRAVYAAPNGGWVNNTRAQADSTAPR